MTSDLNKSLEEWSTNTESVLESLGTSYDTFVEDSIEPLIRQQDSLTDSTIDFYDKLSEKAGEAYAASGQINAYLAALAAQQTMYEGQIKKLETQVKKMGGTPVTQEGKGNSKSGSKSSKNGEDNASNGNGKVEVGDVVTFSGKYYHDS